MSRTGVLICLLGIVALASGDTCSWKSAGGDSYDISSLTKTSGDYTGNDGTYDYKMNICAKSNAGGECSDRGSGFCQFQATDYVASLGEWTSDQPVWSLLDESKPTAGVQLKFTNGDMCYIMGQMVPRNVLLQLRCDKPSSGDTFTISEDQSSCTFTVHLDGVGCPAGSGPSGGGDKGGLSGGWIFVIILLVCSFLYVLIGCIYKAKTKGTTGTESCPNVDLWRSLPGLVKDGCAYTWMMITTGCKGKQASYNEI